MTFLAALRASLQRESAFIRHSKWDFCLLFILPPLAIVVLAVVFHAGVFQRVPVAVVDADHSALSRAIERHLQATPKLRISAMPADLAAAHSLMRAGKIYSVIYLPPGMEKRALRGEDGAVAIYFNAAFQTVAAQAASAAHQAVQTAVTAEVNRTRIGELAPPVRLQPPSVQVTVVGNPQASFELFLEALITPMVLNMLLACAVVFALGRELTDGTLQQWYRAGGGRLLACLLGKLAPYVLVYWLWCVLWTAYLAGWRGWSVAGSLPLLLLAEGLLFCATGAISAFLIGVLRKLDLALSVSCFYTGSGLSFAGATLPLNGGSWFSRAWGAFLPSTSYVQVQEQQWVMASPIGSSIEPLLILGLFVAVPLIIAMLRFRHLVRAPVTAEPLYAPPMPATLSGGFVHTLTVVSRNFPILSMVVFAVILYGFYYPAAYKVQTVVKLPVAVVDLDHSPLSRSFLRNLDATRETDIVVQADSITAAQRLLKADKVDGVIVVPEGLERSVLKGTPGGIDAYLKGAYLVRASYLGQALRESIQGSLREIMAPLSHAVRGYQPGVRIIERPLYNTTGGYGDYVVPGVATIILQATLLFGVAMFMGLMRGAGNRRMTSSAFFGAWGAFTLLGCLTSLFFFGFVLWFQDYPRGGNLPGLLLCVPIFSAAVTALGLLAGSFFQRYERGVQILAGTSIPVFFLCGLSWPHFAMPAWLVAVAKLVPSTTAVPLFLQFNSMGASIGEVATGVATLLILAVLFGAAAWLRLTKPSASPDESRREGNYQHG